MSKRDELLATLRAYALVQQSSWPEMNPTLAIRTPEWKGMSEAALVSELAFLIAETERPGCEVRVFWKVGPDYVFAGGNANLAKDAGLPNVALMLGKTDFDPVFPWRSQAAKYRKDDMAIVTSAQPQLNIIERQNSEQGLSWLQTSKTPIVLESGKAIGLMGMYGVIDRDTAVRLLRGKNL